MFKGMSLEIESVFVDYDDDNRITFQLLNGETVIQPRAPPDEVLDELSDSLSNELRVWNIIKAHWQSQLSMWPGLIHTWVHFHFNDLTVRYIEERWKPGLKHCSDSVMDRIIRSHSYYTAFLNSAGPADGFCNPQMRRWSLCVFLCAPWKTPPVPTEVIHWLFVTNITAFWFTDTEKSIRLQSVNGIQNEFQFPINQKLNALSEDTENEITRDLIAGSGSVPSIISADVTASKSTLSPTVLNSAKSDSSNPSPMRLEQAISLNDVQQSHSMTLSPNSVAAALSAAESLEIKTIQKATSSASGKLPDLGDSPPDSMAVEFALRSVVSTMKKVADPDSFPPIFIRNRLEMFEDEFNSGKKWIEMHRGWHIYKDYLADYYEIVNSEVTVHGITSPQIIHQDFVVKLHNAGYLKNECLERWINCMEKEGFPGISKCKRHGGYLHILSTFLWLNVVHASDHTVANNMVRHWGVNASLVPMMSQQWFQEHGDYDYLDVLEGKDCRSRWRIQFYAMRIRVFWGTFGGPWNQGGFHADHMIDGHLHRHFRDIDGITEDERKEIDGIHKGYIRKMKECDVNYRWLMRVEDLTAGIQY